MLDLGIHVDVVVGMTSITVRDCLKLKRHSVVRLQRSSGSDLDLQVGGIVVASGEVVVVDESTAVRIADLAQPPGSEPEA
jgi:flagellar motor switch protein FliN/FliY